MSRLQFLCIIRTFTERQNIDRDYQIYTLHRSPIRCLLQLSLSYLFSYSFILPRYSCIVASILNLSTYIFSFIVYH